MGAGCCSEKGVNVAPVDVAAADNKNGENVVPLAAFGAHDFTAPSLDAKANFDWVSALKGNKISSLSLNNFSSSENLWIRKNNNAAANLAGSDDDDEDEGELLDVDVLVECLNVNKSLMELYVGQNKLTGADLVKICTVLAMNTSLNLRKLSLTYSSFDIKAVEAIVQCCAAKPSLTYLDLTSCKLKDEGVQALLKSEGLKNVKVLNLNRNKFGDDGMAALTAFVSRSTCGISDLSFSINPFSFASAKLFAAAVEEHSNTLCEVTCLKTKLNMALLRKIRGKMRQNKIALGLIRPPTPEQAEKEIEEAKDNAKE